MFDKNSRYITSGIQHRIPLELQLFLWDCIETLKEQEKELDYLQIFELSKERDYGVFYQKIEHRQEVPEFNKTYKLFSQQIVNAKIFVIDDEDHSTMLLAEEY